MFLRLLAFSSLVSEGQHKQHIIMLFSRLSVHDCSSQTHCTTLTRAGPLRGVYLVPAGRVCFQCDFGGGVANDSQFLLDSSAVGEAVGRVESGVLTVSAAEKVFSSSAPANMTCTSDTYGSSIQALILLEGKKTENTLLR